MFADVAIFRAEYIFGYGFAVEAIQLIGLKVSPRNTASCFEYSNTCSFRDGVYGFYTDGSNDDNLFVLLSYFNSKLSSYYLFMTISSYGIEREQIMKNEYLSIPINLDEEQSLNIKDSTKNILSQIKSKTFLEDDFENQEIDYFINLNIDNVIYESFDFDEYERALISDSIIYNIDLFHKQESSIALCATLKEQPYEYAQIIVAKLNEFLEGQDVFVNATVYKSRSLKSSPLMIIKLSHDTVKRIFYSLKKWLMMN